MKTLKRPKLKVPAGVSREEVRAAICKAAAEAGRCDSTQVNLRKMQELTDRK